MRWHSPCPCCRCARAGPDHAHLDRGAWRAGAGRRGVETRGWRCIACTCCCHTSNVWCSPTTAPPLPSSPPPLPGLQPPVLQPGQRAAPQGAGRLWQDRPAAVQRRRQGAGCRQQAVERARPAQRAAALRARKHRLGVRRPLRQPGAVWRLGQPLAGGHLACRRQQHRGPRLRLPEPQPCHRRGGGRYHRHHLRPALQV